MNKEVCSRLFFISATIWGSIGIFLIFLQVYLMFQYLLFVLPLFLLSEYFFVKGMGKAQRKLRNPSKTFVVASYVAGVVHFIPLILQLGRISAPGFDNVVAALIGLWILWLVPDAK